MKKVIEVIGFVGIVPYNALRLAGGPCIYLRKYDPTYVKCQFRRLSPKMTLYSRFSTST